MGQEIRVTILPVTHYLLVNYQSMCNKDCMDTEIRTAETTTKSVTQIKTKLNTLYNLQCNSQ